MPIPRHFWSICCTGLLLLAGHPAAGLDPNYPLRHYGYQSWQTDDGLPENTVHAVLQTRDGHLWFATEDGLVRFDGAQFAIFDKKNTPQLGSNLIYSLFQDRQGALWIGASGGLTRFQNGVFKLFTTSEGLPANSVWSVYQSRDGRLWALTTSGLGKFIDGHFQPIEFPQGLSATSAIAESSDGSLWVNSGNSLLKIGPGSGAVTTAIAGGEPIQALASDASGRIWIGTHARLRVISSSGGPTEFHLSNGSGADITCLHSTSDGHLWIGTANGLDEYDGKTTRTFTEHDGLPGNRITSLFEDREHAVWAITDRGAARVFGGHISALTPKEGLSSSLVLAFYEDREGSVWLGMDSGGVAVLRDRKFTTYTTQDGLTDDLVRSVFEDHRGEMLVGTNNGGVSKLANGKFSTLTTASNLSSNVALALADDASGGIWIGTPDGLNRVRGNQDTVFTSADGLADDFVRSLYTDRNGALWVGTRHGLSLYQNGKFTSYSAMDGLGSDLVGAVIEDRDNSYWIGTLGGLTHYANGSFTNYTTRQGLSSNVITALYQDADGTLWIGTNGGGLNARINGKFVNFLAAKALPQDIYGILDDSNGNLWLGSSKGVFRVSKKQFHAMAAGQAGSISPDVYGTADGMRISECSSGGHPAAWKAKDGTLWFATLRGAATVDPAHMPVNHVPPLVAIEQVSVDDAVLPMQSETKIAPGHTRIAFQYAGLSFVAPQKVRFRYKLDGLDRDWVDAGSRRVAFYTNIPPGRHTFHVMAYNNDGVWSEQDAAFSFQLLPRFYQTYWFYLLLAACASLLAYAIYQWRVRTVEAQFSAVLAERSRIAREIHDTLAQGFVAVSVQLEVVARLLTTSTDAAKDHLEQARALTRECIAEARSSIWNLRSQGTTQNDLASALTRSAERITASSGVKARVQVSGTFRPIDARVEAEMLRIGQEAITNVVRHAQARTANITLLFEDKLLRMTIQDDGHGFDGDPNELLKNGHFGLTGMCERAEQIGARFTVVSAKDKGTEIQVEVAI
ncbi:sensor histidine kinase [Alloacidobacterium sp.]|uniref:sensor histidine kinase n=1 Tax=Alloacidobacterium sp. TaxID=2951999 RepID=UPI002D4DCA5E|nr:two-component regulator propeller domain-containing protein [Alloacidobacterium sp.]HYK37178.1 two-component regulator propeller domain-containing protein [Alloacidobacterium sp.]